MALEYIFTNNAKSNLAVAMGGSDSTLQVDSGDGSLFPNPTEGSEYFVVLVKEGSTKAFMTCTARATDVLTVTRTDSYSFTTSATVKLVLNATVLTTFLQKGVYRTNAGSPDGSLAASYTGEEVYDSTNDVWYKHTTGTTWKIMNGTGS